MIEVIDASPLRLLQVVRNQPPRKSDGIPVIARQRDCQTCFLSKLRRPEDALTSHLSRASLGWSI